MNTSTTSPIVFGVELSSFDKVGAVACIANTSTETMLKAYAALIGTDPTYKAWEEARVAWCSGYVEQLGETPKANTIDKAWSRFAAGLSEMGLSKPKADTPASVAKAKTEEKKASALETALKAAGLTTDATMEQLRDASLKALENGDAATMKVFSGEMDKRQKAIRAQEEKAAKEAEKAKQPSAILKRLKAKLDTMSGEELAALEVLLDAMLPTDILAKAKPGKGKGKGETKAA